METIICIFLSILLLSVLAWADGEIRPNPFGGGYNGRDNQGNSWQVRPNPFGGGYNYR
jgi:hypothetical protein